LGTDYIDTGVKIIRLPGLPPKGDLWNLYLGAQAEPNDSTTAVGSRWLISAVARINQPGAKADCCLC